MKFKAVSSCLGRFWAWAIIAGLALGFPNHFIELPLLALFWPLGCAMLGIEAQNARLGLLQSWLASFVGAAIALYWLYMPVHNVGNLILPLAILCALFIALVVSSQGAVFALCAQALKDHGPVRAAFALGIIWYLLEYSFAVLVGFPWLTPSGALAAWPALLQTADFIGAYATDGLWLCGLLLCVFALPLRRSKIAWPCLVGGFSLCLAITAYGFARLGQYPADIAQGKPLEAIFVEGNVDQNTKWDPVFQRETLKIYMNLTEDGLSAARAKGVENPLVIWPETAMPFFYQSRPELSAIIRDFVRENGCPLLFGAPGIENLPGEPEPVVFNRAFLLGPSGAILGFYDKEHLVPFGEYLPSWLNFGFLEALLQGVGIYHEGTRVAPLRYGPLALGMLICYEGIFPWLAQERVGDGANILVDISNDGWFGKSPASRQHLLLTVPRCIEQGRWLMRATNTGISAVVDFRGRIALQGPRDRAESILAKAYLRESPSPYHKIAPWLPGFAILLLIVLIWPFNKIKKDSSNK